VLAKENRGGFRVIYYPKMDSDTIWMLTIYPKNVVDNISSRILRRICQEMDDA
jgi:hypothetical protein